MKTGGLLGWVMAAGLAASAASAAVCGCSSSKDSGPPGLGEFAQTFATAYCDALRGCCEKASHPYDEASCRAQMVDTAQRAADVVKRGKVVYDQGAVQACLDAYKSRASLCVEDAGAPADGGYEAYVEACTRVFRGTVPPGQACLESEDCEDDFPRSSGACRTDSRAGADPTKKVCFRALTAAPGEACSLQGSPKAGEFEIRSCDGRVAYCEGTADAAKCRAYAKLGEDCFVPPSTVIQCDSRADLFCDSASRKCASLPAAGQPCTPGQQCAKGAYCEQGAPGPGPTTRTCAARKADGAECGSSSECQSTFCDLSLGTTDGGLRGRCGAPSDLTANAFEVTPRSCGFGPQGRGPVDSGIQPIKTARFAR